MRLDWAEPSADSTLLERLEMLCEDLRNGEVAGIWVETSLGVTPQYYQIERTSFGSGWRERTSIPVGVEMNMDIRWNIWPGPTAIARAKRLENQRRRRRLRSLNAKKGYFGKPHKRLLQFRRRRTALQRQLDEIRYPEEDRW
jgi:hypothetical protein